jgi:hypothetical protein
MIKRLHAFGFLLAVMGILFSLIFKVALPWAMPVVGIIHALAFVLNVTTQGSSWKNQLLIGFQRSALWTSGFVWVLILMMWRF